MRVALHDVERADGARFGVRCRDVMGCFKGSGPPGLGRSDQSDEPDDRRQGVIRADFGNQVLVPIGNAEGRIDADRPKALRAEPEYVDGVPDVTAGRPQARIHGDSGIDARQHRAEDGDVADALADK